MSSRSYTVCLVGDFGERVAELGRILGTDDFRVILFVALSQTHRLGEALEAGSQVETVTLETLRDAAHYFSAKVLTEEVEEDSDNEDSFGSLLARIWRKVRKIFWTA